MRNRFARKMVFSLLSHMSQGKLEVTLPDQSKHVFGNQAADITARIIVDDESMFWRCLLYADLGLAESYMDGLCDFSSIADVVSWFLLNQDGSPVLNESNEVSPVLNLAGFGNQFLHALRHNSQNNSRKNISDHYDLGNNFFQLFLDPTMTYSSALFLTNELTLEQAQLAKFARAAGMLRINPGDRVLDVGCGWGGLSLYMAKTFDCHVTSVTISQQQYDYFSALIRRENLQDRIDLKLVDYRLLEGKFDKIVSIEMIEAVGEEYIDTFIKKLDSLLARNGILLMQMITCPDSRYDIAHANVDFIQKHIFPGSLLQSLHRVTTAMNKCCDLFMVDLFDMTDSYVTTLKLWQIAFENRTTELAELGFDERFIRKWRYYFEYCQAAFFMRNVSVVQATYSRPNNTKLNGGFALH
jgi:cyclopropane-fatty-acyl-phospholipid synthase